jgi:hypothetical protein
MAYPKVCQGCVYRGEEITSNNLVCQNPYRAGPDDNGECEEHTTKEELFGDDEEIEHRTMMDKPISTNDKLPDDKQECLFWHVGHNKWHEATFYAQNGGVFRGSGTRSVQFDGETLWLPMPPPPGEL